MKQILTILFLFCTLSANAQDKVVTGPKRKTQATTSKSVKKTSTTQSQTGYLNGYEWVNMGLSVKWATCNIGASYPSEYGSFYAFGETETKKVYSDETMTFTGKTNVDMAHDAAKQNWGGTWRIPTKAEFNELVKKCKWKWTTINDHGGYIITAANGNSIFLPAAGFHNQESYTEPYDYELYGGVYWTSTIHPNKEWAYALSFNIHGYGVYEDGRCLGCTIRPVTK